MSLFEALLDDQLLDAVEKRVCAYRDKARQRDW